MFVKNSYRTLKGVQEIIEIENKKSSQWLIYKDDVPYYYVDFYLLEEESNAMMNSLVLCGKRSIREVLAIISEKNNVNLHIPKVPKLAIKINSNPEQLILKPLPKEWLSYSL
jgi:hypothetical protein